MELYISKLTARELGRRIDDYFIYIKGEGQPQAKRPVGRPPKYPPAGPVPGKASAKTPPPARPPEPPTITGLALFIGFNSRQEFEDHEKKPRFAPALKRARLKIEAEYEKKLPLTSAAGAIFALKSLGSIIDYLEKALVATTDEAKPPKVQRSNGAKTSTLLSANKKPAISTGKTERRNVPT